MASSSAAAAASSSAATPPPKRFRQMHLFESPSSPEPPPRLEVRLGDCLEELRAMPNESVDCCITSPPYWGLRDYHVRGQIGAEETLDEYIEKLTIVFREIRRILVNDGVLWLNIGDGYTSGGRSTRAPDAKNKGRAMSYRPDTPAGLKPKDLLGIPWKLAFALQKDGWYLRADVIWNKPNCQPESVQDRPTRSHEYVFLLTKSETYYYNVAAVREPSRSGSGMRNRRSVWDVPTQPFEGAHFAVFPPDLVKVCMDAGSQKLATVLDPFMGTGTVGMVCNDRQRHFIGIELNPTYFELARKRLGLSA